MPFISLLSCQDRSISQRMREDVLLENPKKAKKKNKRTQKEPRGPKLPSRILQFCAGDWQEGSVPTTLGSGFGLG
jgi:hypothetical protein